MKNQVTFLLLCFSTLAFGQFKSSIDFIGGLEYSYRILDDEANSISNSPFLDNRSGETGKVNYRFGLNFNHQIKSNIYFKTGIRFFKNSYKSEVTERLIGNDVIGIEGQSIFIDTSLPLSFEIKDFQIVYSHVFLEIPLMMRYEFKKRSLTPFFEVGMSPNFYIITETESFLDNKSSESFSKKNDNYNTVSMVGSLSFGVNYQASKHFQLFAQPIVRYHLTNLTKDKAQEHLYNFGIEVGVRSYLK